MLTKLQRFIAFVMKKIDANSARRNALRRRWFPLLQFTIPRIAAIFISQFGI